MNRGKNPSVPESLVPTLVIEMAAGVILVALSTTSRIIRETLGYIWREGLVRPSETIYWLFHTPMLLGCERPWFVKEGSQGLQPNMGTP